LLREVDLLAGPRYARGDGAAHRVRWGRQRGSIYAVRARAAGRDRWRQGPARGGGRCLWPRNARAALSMA
jgi:hypothetical protein